MREMGRNDRSEGEAPMKRACILSAVFILLSSFAHAGDIVSELIKKQNSTTSVKAIFEQEKHTALMARPIRNSGVFYFKKPGLMRWEYAQSMTVVFDGDALYIYYPEMKEAEKITGASRFGSAMDFNLEKMKEEYSISASDAPEGARLILKPFRQSQIASIELIFPKDGAFPKEVLIEEQSGDRTKITFSEAVFNSAIPDGIFSFSPAPGTRIRQRSIP